jgi:hypothetical protein
LIRFKTIFFPSFVILILIVIALVFQYGINVKYKFPDPRPFSGGYLYNPYNNIDTSMWKISNFHAHTHKFAGKPNSISKNSRYLDSIYNYLGYDLISISDYQKINSFESKNPGYIPVYEHGYQYYKNHQLVINAGKVSWLDYFFRQTLDNKQFVINRLKKDSTVILTIVHPILRKAYSKNDFKYLTNYNCLEVANNKYLFISNYDTVLSWGHRVFLMADDDEHNLQDPDDCGTAFNILNSVLVKDSILNALKTGRSISVKLDLNNYKTFKAKKTAIGNLPMLTDFTVKNDTIYLCMNKNVKTIKFIGQHGTEMKIITDKRKASYFFTENDTYIRTEIECSDGTLLFLNPVFRNNGVFRSDPSPPVDVQKTLMYRIIIFLLIFSGFTAVYYKKYVQK